MNDFTKEQTLAAYRTLPEVIRDAFNDPGLNAVMAALQKTYQLHIDTTSIINIETGYLLLGLTNPTQYVERIRTRTGLADSIVSSIAKEVNEKILVPLHQKIRAGSEPRPAGQVGVPSYQAPKPPMPQTSSAPAPRPSTPQSGVTPRQTQPQSAMQQPAPRPTQTPPAERPYAMPPKPPQPQAAQMPRPVAPYQAPVAPRAAPPPPNLPGVMGDDQMLPDHEVAHINVGGGFTVNSAQPSIPPRPPMSRPLSSPATPPPQVQKPIATYSADPYREPF